MHGSNQDYAFSLEANFFVDERELGVTESLELERVPKNLSNRREDNSGEISMFAKHIKYHSSNSIFQHS